MTPPPRFRIQITIGKLLVLMVLVALSIANFQYAWPRRTLSTLVVVPAADVQVLQPCLDTIQANVPVISNLRIDRPTNSLVFNVQARHQASATNLMVEIVNQMVQ